MKSLVSALALYFVSSMSTSAGLTSDQGATINDVSTPPWKSLQFLRKSIWGDARAAMRIDTDWTMHVLTTLGKNNREEVILKLTGSQGAIIEKQRYSQGRKDRRFKSLSYSGNLIKRTRIDPAKGEIDLPVKRWTQQNVQQIRVENLPANQPLTTPYTLFMLASSAQLSRPGHPIVAYVHTDYNVYQVELSNSGTETLNTAYTLEGSTAPTQVKHVEFQTDRISLNVTPVFQPGRYDFEVMGLSEEIHFLVDPVSRLPLRIYGKAPRVGEAHLDLIEAQL